jgi:hypothetical protein
MIPFFLVWVCLLVFFLDNVNCFLNAAPAIYSKIFRPFGPTNMELATSLSSSRSRFSRFYFCGTSRAIRAQKIIKGGKMGYDLIQYIFNYSPYTHTYTCSVLVSTAPYFGWWQFFVACFLILAFIFAF